MGKKGWQRWGTKGKGKTRGMRECIKLVVNTCVFSTGPANYYYSNAHCSKHKKNIDKKQQQSWITDALMEYNPRIPILLQERENVLNL